MAYFAMPYRVLYHDTMAQGSHHFLTNLKFQCEAREHFFFGLITDPTPEGRALLESTNLITLDGYARSLAPVEVGETVGILLSIEDQTPSSLRFCFRVVRRDGKPVSCGFQTLVSTSRRTGEITVGAELIGRVSAPFREKLRWPTFQERVLAGGSGLKDLFDDEAIRAAVAVAREFKPSIVPDLLLPAAELVHGPDAAGVVFLFPGQGSWDPAFLTAIQRLDPSAIPIMRRLDGIAAAALGGGFLGANGAAAPGAADAVQVGIYASAVLSARYLIGRGAKPCLLLGHSFGELAALAVGGAFEYEDGATLVCERVKALQSVPSLQQAAGGMIALAADESRARSLVAAAAPSTLRIALVNHPGQTVISGTQADLQRLAPILRDAQVSGAPVKSRYPFHSPLLQDAVAPFAEAVRRFQIRPLHTPVYSAAEASLHARQPDLAALLPRHLVQPSIFTDAIECAHALGGRLFVECGAGRVLGGLVQRTLHGRPGVTTVTFTADEIGRLPGVTASSAPVAIRPVSAEPAPQPAAAREPAADGPEPIAIVSLGSVLPGASDPEGLWRLVLSGRTGIVDLGDLDATLVADFKAEERLTPDKTYTLLCGRASDQSAPVSAALSEAEAARLPTAGRFFAQAATQCLSRLQSPLPPASRIQVIVGSTADGSREYDEALVLAGVEQRIQETRAPGALVDAFRRGLERVSGRSLERAGHLSGPRAYTGVAEALFGSDVKVLAVDAACASSLYAIDLGIEALRDGRCDVAICGGAFAPGPASTCLFAQFQGLSANGSKPLDAAADGVVFGEGAALVMLKRLTDAVAAGDRIHGVIRTVAASSDGKSASVMEPKQGGQLLALRRAWQRSGISPTTLQFIDAHATATPVGDAVEFASIREAVGPPQETRRRVRVGSLKAAIGHTGWVAGAASLVELCQALASKTFPPQVGFVSPNPHFQLEASNLAIEAAPSPWPENDGGLPRRAGINGFGFGGVNAHLLLEEFDPGSHGTWKRPSAGARAAVDSIAIVGMSSLLPETRTATSGHAAWRFGSEELRLPRAIRMLPDVVDDLDPSQVLAIKAAHEVISTLPATWAALRPDTGVMLGFDGKTRRGIDALLRIHLDRLKRRFADVGAAADPETARALEPAMSATLAAIERMRPSGPYTLAGAMPNVTAGRVSNVFNLNGPNFVVDAEGWSLYEAIAQAAYALGSGKCRFVLAGGISSSAGADVQRLVHGRDGGDRRPIGEGAIVFALARAETAAELGLPVCGYLSGAELPAPSAGGSVTVVGSRAPAFLMGAEGAVELTEAMERVRASGESVVVRWVRNGKPLEIRLAANAAEQAARPADSKPIADAAASPLSAPIRWTAPRWIAEDAPAAPRAAAWTGRRVLILTDQPAWCFSADVARALRGMDVRVVCPAACRADGAIAIATATDQDMQRSLQQLDGWTYDAIVALKNLEQVDPIESVTASAQVTGGLLDLMFAVARHAYPRLERGEVTFGALCLNAAASPERVHPFTGLVSGFVRSLAREVRRATCRQVNTASGDVTAAFAELAAEFERPAAASPPEVCYAGGRRFVQQLVEVGRVGRGAPLLTRDSVVVATGGARGVTAVLVEALRRECGCTTVLLGRTDPAAAPPSMLAMDEDAFERSEPEFYEREMARTPGIRPAELKARFNAYRAAREAAVTIRALEATAGAVRYIRTDVTDAAQVDAAIARVVAEFGRVDLVLHGAGIQTSKVLQKKSLETFRSIVATKLGGLGHLVEACRRHVPHRRPHLHLVTSTFSHAGNPGQEDYGAANLAMDRLAHHLAMAGGEFDASSLGWIGWVRIGMTRGSEYTTLAIQRGLSGVTRDTGMDCFRQYVSGRTTAPVTYVITDREASFFGLPIAAPAPEPADAPRRIEEPLLLSTEAYPFLDDHLVAGVPTLPASFGLDIAARIACTLRPGKQLQRFVNVSVERFVKIPGGRPFNLRRVAEVIEERTGTSRILVRLMSDFVHASGRVLQADIVHMSTEVLLGPAAEPAITHDPVATVQSGWRLSDPYLHPAAPVRLGGPFRSLHDITLTPAYSTATFGGPDADAVQSSFGSLLPFVLLDALWRMAALRREDDGSALVCVPLSCAQVDVLQGTGPQEGGRCILRSSAPRIEGDRVHVSWAEAIDASGRVVLTLQHIVGAVYGKVPAEVERIRLVRAEPIPNEAAAAAPGIVLRPSSRSRPFDGRIALVTGSGRGIGRVVAMQLADLGASVIVNSFHSRSRGEDTTAEIVARGGQAIHVWGSVAQPAQLAKIFEEIDARAGGLDFFVSNASTGIFAPLQHVTVDHWDRSFRTNVVALHQASLLAAERMSRRGGGRIVALSSIGARWCFDYFGLVGPVKAAVEALVGYLAVELAPLGVEVSAVAAGAVDGELLRQYTNRPRWENLAPDGLMTTEAQVAEAVAFLLTAGGMNGTTLVLDGASGVRTCESTFALSSQGERI